jgi:two-component system, LytTR family, response regulator
MHRAVIIDDENSCVESLSALLGEHCKTIQVIATGSTVEQGISLIKELRPQLIFLDIELKNDVSFSILDKVRDQEFHVIFTTAHEKYAVRAIKTSCLDYLLKPVDPVSLIEAVNKFIEQDKAEFNRKKIQLLLDNLELPEGGQSKIAIPNKDGYVFVDTGNIIYCKADTKYTEVYTTGKECIVSSKNLGEFEELLFGRNFFRCHKSFLVNINYIRKFLKSENRIVMANDQQIDVSVRKKDEFMRLFEKF